MNQAAVTNKHASISQPVTITDLNHEGHGVARVDGKVVFISGALPGEVVTYRIKGRRRRKYDTAELVEIITASPDRIEPKCKYFNKCGGCRLQHLSFQAQIQWKQNTLKENLLRIGNTEPENWLPALTANEWAYRRKARLGVKYIEKQGGILIGFRGKQSSRINALQECLVLDERVSKLLPGLHELFNKISCNDKIPQIEISVGDSKVVFIIRHLVPFTSGDEDRFIEFAKLNNVEIYLQPKGPNTIIPLWPATESLLTYKIEQSDITIHFRPTSFTQVNSEINQKMISQVIKYLEPGKNDRVLDLFCGLGNFTLPIAKHAGKVIGIEGDDILVHSARDNAEKNGITNAEFTYADLFDEARATDWRVVGYNKLLLDPPRSGAKDVVQSITKNAFEKIVYVSCNPSTLARDASVLVHEKNYRLTHAGVMDMFPHTKHVESLAVFERSE
ncbi:MAG: 23S rRNA (uracil(1939)-C(5))-methyltransferase RlmD [Acidiferrobacterales bacterium]